MSAKLFNLHQGPKIWMGTNGGWPFEEKLLSELGLAPWVFESGWNVGNFAAHIAYFLGFTQVEFAGMDQENEPREGKKDFYYGGQWLKELKQNRPLYETVEEVSEKNPARDQVTALPRDQVVALLRKVHNGAARREISTFLAKAAGGSTASELNRAKILMEAELMGDIFYEALLVPLWEMLGPLYLRDLALEERATIKAALFQAAFYLRVLEAHGC